MLDCTFELNNKSMSAFVCGGKSFPAFSGLREHVNRPTSACHVGVGPIPKKAAGRSEGFIAINQVSDFFLLRTLLKNTKKDLVPGAQFETYDCLTVK